MSADDMQRFWDDRARENAAYYVDNQLEYTDTDMEQFWGGGPGAVEDVLAAVDAPEIGPSHVVLEIGCGLGRLTRPLAARAGKVIAQDISSEMLERARAANPQLTNVEWLHGDGSSLAGVADDSVDVVFSHVVFQHIPDPAITLGYVREIGRVLRPGGWAAFQISNDPSIHALSRPLLERIKSRLGRGPQEQEHPAWRGSAIDLDDLRAAAAASGTEVAALANEGTQFCIVRLAATA